MAAVASGKTPPISVSPDLRCQNRSPSVRTQSELRCLIHAIIAAPTQFWAILTKTSALRRPADLRIGQFTKMAGCCPTCFDVRQNLGLNHVYLFTGFRV